MAGLTASPESSRFFIVCVIFDFSSSLGIRRLDHNISIFDFLMTNQTSTQSAATGPPEFFSVQVFKARRFYLNLNPAPSTRLAVVSGGLEHCAPNYVIRRKSFPFYAVEFVVGGGGRVKFGRKEYRLEPGSVFSYGPGMAHEMHTDPHRPLTKYFVDFAGTQAERLLRNCKMRPGTIAQVFPGLETQPLFDALIRVGLRGTPQAPLTCARLLEALLIETTESRLSAARRDTLAFATYQRCREYLQQHFLRLRSLGQLAAECHVNPAYLCRLFRRYDHQTPSRQILRLKINYAAERLQAPGVLAKQVAEETGFADPFHFSRAFKSIFGVSPRMVSRIR